jgi:2-hydroxycyclohexanecarboxyl-CoA dehydrogenase
MDLGLKGKVAVVTGSGTGIGRVIVLTLAQEGASVVVTDVLEDRIKVVAEEVKDLGVNSMAVQADVTNIEQVNAMVKKVIDGFGQIDILVNNAGRGGNWEAGYKPGPFVESKKEDWDYTINLCLYGVMNCTKAVLPHMISRKYGKIVNMISDAGRVGDPFFAAYGAAKAGVVNLIKTLAKENGRYNINVNGVSAATTKTERISSQLAGDEEREKKILRLYPLGRLGEPQDLANAVVFFASDRASWITGQTLSVDGGYAMAS